MSMDQDWKKIKAGLEDPKWDFRTIEGLAKETHLTNEQVEKTLNHHRSEVRKTLDGHGRALYTIASRPIKLREFFANTQAILSR